ncbi:MAG: ABC transporter permease, partial [Firmicutes bacterium]|nr:ABC transporter permease [Bacillota bacterium]
MSTAPPAAPRAAPLGAVPRVAPGDGWRRLARIWWRNPLNAIGSVIILGLVGVAVAAPLIAPYDPLQQVLSERLQPPSARHWFGTDQFGRDIFSRVVYGTRIELQVIFIVSLLGSTLGTAVGLVSGYFGRWVDEVLMRLTDIFLAFPSLGLAMAFAAALGPSLPNMILAIAVVT